MHVLPFRAQLLKWVGNKQRFAHAIIAHFPQHIRTYIEPFLGSGAILGTLAPSQAIAGDALRPLMQIWQTLQHDPRQLEAWYAERWRQYQAAPDPVHAYEAIKAAYNARPNGADLLFLARACYGGVVRFRQADGYMSTPCGVHDPIKPAAFAQRVALWHQRTQGTCFVHADFETLMAQAQAGDLVYCDPPYQDTQAILYGAQGFTLSRLLQAIADCKARGVYVVLSIDGSKKNGRQQTALDLPPGLFEREVAVNCGRSMLRRFQMRGQTLEDEIVTDRLLLTWG